MAETVLKNIRKVFISKNEDDKEVVSIDDASFTVADGEFVSIIGPSGCGKTTLLRIVAGLETQTSGDVLVNGEPVQGPSPKRGMVFQEYSLFPWKSVIDNVAFGLRMQGIGKQEAREKAHEYLDLVGLSEFAASYPNALSGGMKQRVAIARALANDPDVLLMDEPFGALDAQTRNTLQNELLRICKEEKLTVIFVTHSVDEAVYLSDKIIILSARPATVAKEILIDLPKPRDRTRSTENAIRNDILHLLKEAANAGVKKDRSRTDQADLLSFPPGRSADLFTKTEQKLQKTCSPFS